MSKVVEKKRKHGREIKCETLILGDNSRARYYHFSMRCDRATGRMEWLVRVSTDSDSPGMHIGSRGSRQEAREVAERYQGDVEWNSMVDTMRS